MPHARAGIGYRRRDRPAVDAQAHWRVIAALNQARAADKAGPRRSKSRDQSSTIQTGRLTAAVWTPDKTIRTSSRRTVGNVSPENAFPAATTNKIAAAAGAVATDCCNGPRPAQPSANRRKRECCQGKDTQADAGVTAGIEINTRPSAAAWHDAPRRGRSANNPHDDQNQQQARVTLSIAHIGASAASSVAARYVAAISASKSTMIAWRRSQFQTSQRFCTSADEAVAMRAGLSSARNTTRWAGRQSGRGQLDRNVPVVRPRLELRACHRTVDQRLLGKRMVMRGEHEIARSNGAVGAHQANAALAGRSALAARLWSRGGIRSRRAVASCTTSR